MNPTEIKNLHDELESMPLSEARKDISSGVKYGDITSPKHRICQAWLDRRDAEERDIRDSSMIRKMRLNNIYCLVAAIMATIAAVVAIMAYIK